MENELGEQTPKTETGTETPETLLEENPEEKSKELQSAIAQKEHFRTKSEKLQKELDEVKSKLPKEEKSEPVEMWEASDDPLEIVKLSKVLKDYSDEETEFILKNAPSKDVKGISEATKNPYVQSAIQVMREKVVNNNAIPSPSGASLGSFKVKTQEELAKIMDKPAEVKKYFEEFEKHAKKSMGV